MWMLDNHVWKFWRKTWTLAVKIRSILRYGTIEPDIVFSQITSKEKMWRPFRILTREHVSRREMWPFESCFLNFFCLVVYVYISLVIYLLTSPRFDSSGINSQNLLGQRFGRPELLKIKVDARFYSPLLLGKSTLYYSVHAFECTCVELVNYLE